MAGSRKIPNLVKRKHVFPTIFLILVLVLLSSFAISNLIKPNLAPKNGGFASPQTKPCIVPPVYPQLITQSGTICTNSYNYGIGVGADNLKIICQQGTNFNGISWNGSNGLTIQGRRNITVEGCNFNFFSKNGIFIGNVTPYTAEINLLKVNSSSNNENGIFVGHNAVNIRVNQSEITNNNQDGLLFKANYFGEINSNALLFPRGIYILENKILHNHQNGVNFDAHDYHTYFYSINYSYYYSIALNNSIQIIRNSIKGNYRNGIQNIGLDTGTYTIMNDAPYRNHGYFYILNNTIDLNGFNLTGSGIALVINKSDRIINNVSGTSQLIKLDYIARNDITNNMLDGVSMSSFGLQLPWMYRYFEYGTEMIFANYIGSNRRYGISTTFNLTNVNFGRSSIEQNAILNNGDNGIYFQGLENSNPGVNFMTGYMTCNDIVLSGNGSKNGLQIGRADNGYSTLSKNIVEGNMIGIFAEDNSQISWMMNNYIGGNSIGLLLNKSTLNITDIQQNDFNQTGLQAFDILLNPFSHNWWSDYSPTCNNTNPQDQWCDVSRPIPVANQDIEPKAGNSWGNKNRGYFVRANPGVTPKSGCFTFPFPDPPIIYVPEFPEEIEPVPVIN